jgi:hypothetical protein
LQIKINDVKKQRIITQQTKTTKKERKTDFLEKERKKDRFFGFQVLFFSFFFSFFVSSIL